MSKKDFTPKTPFASSVTTTQLVLPTHTNSLDTVFGGQVMSWVDIAAAISAEKHCRNDVVTASIDALHFVAPAYVGWAVEIKARVNYAFKTSMEVGVRVDSLSPKRGIQNHIASAYLTFVAIDKEGRPVIVPKVDPQTEDDKRRAENAQSRRKTRLLEKKKINEKN